VVNVTIIAIKINAIFFILLSNIAVFILT